MKKLLALVVCGVATSVFAAEPTISSGFYASMGGSLNTINSSRALQALPH